MKKIRCELTGITPLLMNSPKSMLEPEKTITNKTQKRNTADEAEKGAYRMKSGNLYVPSSAIMGCLINAASYKKAGKYSLKPLLAGSVRIEKEELDLGTQAYDLDIRTVVIQRKDRIVRVRPKILTWKINFDMVYNEKIIGDHNIIKECLEEGGQRVGILDYRPQKLGSFGMFEVTKWAEVD